MSLPKIPASRWFLYGSTGLLVFLCLALLLAGLLLMQRASQPRVGILAGSSMEPTLAGPRVVLPCPACAFANQFCIDAWKPGRPCQCMRCGGLLSEPDPPTILPGQTVRYVLPDRRMRFAPSEPNTAGLQRGDLVVIARQPDGLREVKRIVGLPGEQLSIREGDLWIDDQRHQKSLSQFLQQAILVGHWSDDGEAGTPDLDAFLEAIQQPILNDLPGNAHDSIAYVPVRDLGISLRIKRSSPPWSLRLVLSNAGARLQVDLERDAEFTASCHGQAMSAFPVPTSVRRGAPLWLTVACVDGRIFASDETQTWSIAAAPPCRDEPEVSNQKLDMSVVALHTVSGTIEFDRCLIYRDIVYRGFADTPAQTIAGGDGYVVLGDNVSISDDSRSAGESSGRVPLASLRGWVLPDAYDLANLIRQAHAIPSVPLQSSQP